MGGRTRGQSCLSRNVETHLEVSSPEVAVGYPNRKLFLRRRSLRSLPFNQDFVACLESSPFPSKPSCVSLHRTSWAFPFPFLPFFPPEPRRLISPCFLDLDLAPTRLSFLRRLRHRHPTHWLRWASGQIFIFRSPCSLRCLSSPVSHRESRGVCVILPPLI